MTLISIRREIADLVLEAVDIAVSRKLAPRETDALVLEVVGAERPDIAHHDLRALVGRVWRRLGGIGALPVASGAG
jgi:hypothetical protein